MWQKEGSAWSDLSAWWLLKLYKNEPLFQSVVFPTFYSIVSGRQTSCGDKRRLSGRQTSCGDKRRLSGRQTSCGDKRRLSGGLGQPVWVEHCRSQQRLKVTEES